MLTANEARELLIKQFEKEYPDAAQVLDKKIREFTDIHSKSEILYRLDKNCLFINIAKNVEVPYHEMIKYLNCKGYMTTIITHTYGDCSELVINWEREIINDTRAKN